MDILMSLERADVRVRGLIAELPRIPHPWGIEEFCSRLEAKRGRKLLLHPLKLPALPFGLWHDDGERDHIIYRLGASGYYRDHIILHEICHMLAGHNRVTGHSCNEAGTNPVSVLVEHAMRNPHTDVYEELAEIFAATVLNLAKRDRPASASAFERRAAAIFGMAD